MTRKVVAALGALFFACVSLAVFAPAATADPANHDEVCFSRLADVDDCAWLNLSGGQQADGSGVYLDSVFLDCSGRLEGDPSLVVHRIEVYRLGPNGGI